MKIYEALYNEMTEESSSATLSLHRTREGAEKAIQEHKNTVMQGWLKRKENLSDEAKELAKFLQWDDFQHWDIREAELLD